MSERQATYQTGQAALLINNEKCATMEVGQPIIDGEIDWAHVERILSYLVPVLNLARKEQGKKPVIVPKG